MSNQTINLDCSKNQILGTIRTTSDNVHNWFTASAKPKLETFCHFQKKNKFRYYRIRKIKSGEIVLSVKPLSGPLITERGRNLHLAFIKLQRNFYGHF